MYVSIISTEPEPNPRHVRLQIVKVFTCEDQKTAVEQIDALRKKHPAHRFFMEACKVEKE